MPPKAGRPEAQPPPPPPPPNKEEVRAVVLAKATAEMEDWLREDCGAIAVLNPAPKAPPGKRTEVERREAQTAKRQRQKEAKAKAKGGAVAEKAKDVAVPGSSAAASSGPGASPVSYTGVPIPKQKNTKKRPVDGLIHPRLLQMCVVRVAFATRA